MLNLFDGKVKAWTEGVPLDPKTLGQVANTVTLPFIFKHVALMPDAHLGIGATVGSVVATKGAIIPAAVGVDIGCGMMAVKIDLDANDLPNLSELRGVIEDTVPVGQGQHRDAFGNLSKAWGVLSNLYYNDIVIANPERFQGKDQNDLADKAFLQLGTLGGGNHFIEVCVDQDNAVWIMLHSGSRGIGNKIGTYFIELAKKDMELHFINLPDKDLAYLPEGTENFDRYWKAVKWAQMYAEVNRQLMMQEITLALQQKYGLLFLVTDTAVNCHHNFVDRENHFGENVLVTRKGAVRARKDDLGIIPGSMGAKSFIVRGLGNPLSYHSSSHGAGRVMSRGEAKKKFTEQDLLEQTSGVECRKDTGVLDEIPGAYKNIDAVMAAQADLVEIKYTLKQVVCVKG